MSKPMSEQMQKLATRYEKATGKKFNAKTNAQKIRSMTDEELAKLFEELCYDSMAHRAKYWLHWLQRPADFRDKRHAHKNVSLSSAGESRVLILG